MIHLSGLFFPLPEGIRWIALFSPAFHLNQLALSSIGVPNVRDAVGPTMHTAALLGVTVLFAGLTIDRLSRATRVRVTRADRDTIVASLERTC